MRFLLLALFSHSLLAASPEPLQVEQIASQELQASLRKFCARSEIAQQGELLPSNPRLAESLPENIRLTASLKQGLQPLPRMRVTVSAIAEDETGKEGTTRRYPAPSWSLWFSVQCWAPVWLTTQPLVAGEKITARSIRQAEVDITQLSGQPATEPLARVLQRAVEGDRVLLKRDLRSGLFISRNSPITLLVQQGELQFTFATVATSSASLGETIWVKSLNERKSVAGTVIGEGLVRLD